MKREILSPKILVVLHLFYNDEWTLINKYLSTLKPYNFDLKITVTEKHIDYKILSAIKHEYPKCEITTLSNIGYDVAPFIYIINQTDLSKYDIVYKIQSKDIKKHSRFVYGQVFRRQDWFLNLYRGIFGKFRTHRIIRMFAKNPKLGLVAAKNLIIHDPKHKQFFTHRIAEKFNIKICDNYRYVAGTCFAMRAECLKPIKDLGLTLSDFEATKPGTFSTAHAFERIICAVAEYNGFEFRGLPTIHNPHFIKRIKKSRHSAIRILDDPAFNLDYDFFYKSLECAQVKKYEIVEIKLDDIRRVWYDGCLYKLNEVSPYRYLTDKIHGPEIYQKYCDVNSQQCGFDMNLNRYNTLIKSITDNGFDDKYMPVIDKHNIIMDGQHRCCILLHKYGPNYTIKALKIYW